MGAKHWIIFIVIVSAIIGGMVYTSIQGRLDLSDINKEKAAQIIGPEERNGNIGDHVYGNKDAKVVLIEYGDFQCPGCKAVAPQVKQLAEKYKDDLAFVYRNFPLTTIHPNARAAAASAEAAGKQGKYWEMHELLFAAQEDWSTADVNNRNDTFLGYAKQLQLDTEKFKTDTASKEITQKIDFDVAMGKMFGVTGTPAFFIGEEQINTQASDTALEDAIKEALKAAGVKIKDEKQS